MKTLTKNQLVELSHTYDDDLQTKFPGFPRRVLRDLKRKFLDNKLDNKKVPKILVLDIETSQMIVKVWQLNGNDYIEPTRIIRDWFVLCWSAKWLFDDEMITGVLTPSEAKEGNDERIVKKMWKLLDETDIVIAHNGNQFDIKKLKTRFLKHSLGLPSPYQSIDTLETAKREFRLSSNKLDYICEFTKLDRKIDTGGIALWDQAEQGDKDALDKMNEYCQNDVKILEEMYLKLRPYMRNHPNLALYMESDYEVCPNCGGEHLKWGYLYRTRVNTYECAKCNDCGAYMRSRQSFLDKDRKSLILT